MTAPDARRYTDAQIRADPDVYAEVVNEYLRDYHGDFDLLLSYQRRLALGFPLTVPMLRATLNCMRFDARVVNLPEPQALADVVDLATRRAPRPTFVPDAPQRAHWLPLRTTWRKTYGISSYVTARVVHRINPASHFLYATATGEFTCRLSWLCKTPWSMGRASIELLTLAEANAVLANWPGWRACSTCARLAEKEE